MKVVIRWSVPLSRFPGEVEEERMIAAQDAIEEIENEVLGEIEDSLGQRDGAGDCAVSAQFARFYDLPDGGHGRETSRAQYLVEVEHPSENFVAAVVGRFGGEVLK